MFVHNLVLNKITTVNQPHFQAIPCTFKCFHTIKDHKLDAGNKAYCKVSYLVTLAKGPLH